MLRRRYVVKVELYDLIAPNGKHIRKATRVLFGDGKEVKFMERMGKKEAIRQAREIRIQNAINMVEE